MKSLSVGFFTQVKSLDPARVQDFVCQQIIEQLYDAPYRLGPNRRVEPVLFDGPLERRGRSGGKARLVGRLAPGLVFSDGSPVTPIEVVDSLRRAAPITARADVESSGAEVHFLLEEEDPQFEVALCHRWCAVVKRVGDRLLGTGPFVVREPWSPGHVVVERNERAASGAKLDRIEFKVYGGETQAEKVAALKQAIRDGEVDLTSSLARGDLKDLREVRKDFQPSASTAMVTFNTEHSALADVEVRRAICEAIDRVAIARVQYENPHAFVARSVLPPSMFRGSDGIRHAPAQARERLARSGVHPNRPLRLMTMWGPRPYLPYPRKTAQLLGEQLQTIGIEIEVVTTHDSLDYLGRSRSGSYDMTLSGWIADTPDPYDFLAALLHSKSVPGDENMAYSNNTSRYRDSVFDEQLSIYRRTGTREALNAVMERIADQAPISPLLYGPSIVVHRWRVTNTKLGATGMPDFRVVDVEA